MCERTTRHARRWHMLAGLILWVVFAEGVTAQTFRLSGRVTDLEDGEALPSATVRIAGTSRGTITNVDGQYVLRLPPGPVKIVFSYVGYQTDTLTVPMAGDRSLDVVLRPVSIELQEIVVTDEDPAYRIMRKVIENKHRWKDSLRSYQFKAFTRQVLRRDTAIASITESYTHGYWRAGDTLREVVVQKRQTENIPLRMNFAFVGQIENFYDDELDFLGFRFVGPTSPEAFDYYRFFLEAVKEDNGVPLYEIRMEPLSRVTPLFAGRLMVIGDSFALVGIDVRPNEAYVIPFLSDLSITYAQGFSQYGGLYWMPTDIRIQGAIEVGIIGISLPRVGFEQTSTIYDYSINADVPDSMFMKPRLVTAPESTIFDSTFWAENEVLPLTTEEEAAYENIDSTQTLEKQFAPSGPLTGLDGGMFAALEYIDLRFNRAEGLFLGGKIAIDTLTSWLAVSARAGYGFSDMRWKYSVGAAIGLESSTRLRMGADVYDDIGRFHDELALDAFGISLTSLFAKNDPRDYYYVRGFSPYVEIAPLRLLMVRFRYRDEQHRLARQSTDYSFFFRGKSYRELPEAVEGRLRSLVFETQLGDEPVPFGLVSRDFLEAEFEVSPGRSLASDFDYSWLSLRGEYHIADFLTRNLFPPTLTAHASGGVAWGSVPPQRIFSLPSTVTGFGPLGVLRGSRVREFGGTRYLVFSLEQNFRSVPFLLLDIPFLYKNGIEFMVHGTIARSWADGTAVVDSLATGGWYSEVGAGIGKILGFIRCDVSYRFFKPSRFVVTFALSRIL